MARSDSITVYREVEDIYNPDPEADPICVAIEVEFTTARAEPNVGIMRDYVDDWWVESTDSDLCDVAQAEAWLESGRKRFDWKTQKFNTPDRDAARALDQIHEAG
jgi:hypothetical protein